mmetsp:Transcript_14668/g.39987  ORF Transcript_14668/g.39987 Transcript_14668/m.39987 type:complete len:230 (-) Transcript_14668:295-984(-)
MKPCFNLPKIRRRSMARGHRHGGLASQAAAQTLPHIVTALGDACATLDTGKAQWLVWRVHQGPIGVGQEPPVQHPARAVRTGPSLRRRALRSAHRARPGHSSQPTGRLLAPPAPLGSTPRQAAHPSARIARRGPSLAPDRPRARCAATGITRSAPARRPARCAERSRISWATSPTDAWSLRASRHSISRAASTMWTPTARASFSTRRTSSPFSPSPSGTRVPRPSSRTK